MNFFLVILNIFYSLTLTLTEEISAYENITYPRDLYRKSRLHRENMKLEAEYKRHKLYLSKMIQESPNRDTLDVNFK